MRIISGEYKGRRLVTPDDRSIRPTSDKVREAMFSILQNDIPEAVCCDLFAGTGCVGIEALSRGALRCYFGDSSRDAVRIIRSNLAHCHAEERAVVMLGDYQRVLRRFREKIDLFFLDPPYHAGLYENCMLEIGSLDLLAPNGIIIAERESRSALPEQIGPFSLVRERRYGKTTLDFYRKTESDQRKKAEGPADAGLSHQEGVLSEAENE